MGPLKIIIVILSISLVFEGTAIELPERPGTEPLKWWQEEVVYQIYPRSFQDTVGEPEEGTGDLKGITSRLDHFTDLGIGSVWISPIYKSPMVDFGYDISDFKDIDEIFGTMEDFRAMSKAMKDKGIKLIMDFVPNHSSDKHEWFERSVNKEALYEEYYVWRNPNMGSGVRQPPNNWRSVFGGPAWTWNEKRGQYYLHQFTPQQPDLNFESPLVKMEMMRIINFWIAEGVDGFRMDAVPHLFEHQSFADEPVNTNPPEGSDCSEENSQDYACLIHDKTYNLPAVLDYLAQLRALIDQASTEERELVMMVEATIPDLDELFKYYGTDDKPIAHYPFNFEFINRIKKDFSAKDIFDIVEDWYTKMPAGLTANWLLGNHDNGRVGSRFAADVIDPFNMINLLLPGSSVTYYGEEIGMLNVDISWEDTVDPPGRNAGPDRYHLFSRDPARTPMQWDGISPNAGFSTAAKTWLPMHPDWEEINVETQLESNSLSHIQVYKMTLKLRKTDTWRYGSLNTVHSKDGTIFGFTRIYKDDGFLYLANFGAETENVNLTSLFEDIPETANVYLTSVGFVPPTNIRAEMHLGNVIIGRRHALILEWVSGLVTDPPTSSEGPTSANPTTPTTPKPTSTTAGAPATFGHAVHLSIFLLVSILYLLL